MFISIFVPQKVFVSSFFLVINFIEFKSIKMNGNLILKPLSSIIERLVHLLVITLQFTIIVLIFFNSLVTPLLEYKSQFSLDTSNSHPLDLMNCANCRAVSVTCWRDCTIVPLPNPRSPIGWCLLRASCTRLSLAAPCNQLSGPSCVS